jgi:hypothetical protein
VGSGLVFIQRRGSNLKLVSGLGLGLGLSDAFNFFVGSRESTLYHVNKKKN